MTDRSPIRRGPLVSWFLGKTVKWFEVLAVILLVGAVYLPGLDRVRFHGDESGRPPFPPYVKGVLGEDGLFRPTSREIND